MINQVGVSNCYSCLVCDLFGWNFGIFYVSSLHFTGIDVQESGRRNWLIQVLFEYALGMKLSTDYQTEGICLSAVHQSSGNS